eukprot:TRINITY_DN187_c0_g1_i1.p2 TRINITY_DN187_c0_g1~~TRINITY_DN187_c0_g1_i1.p2  ORF type:complete len:111 (-),score=29.69 TRINITY_DN187_c0_g1_i1:108-440(-)
MIEEGHVNAAINARDAMVAFKDDPETYDSSTTLSRISTEIHNTMALDRKLRAVDQELQLSAAYVQRVHFRDQRGPRGGFGGMMAPGDFADDDYLPGMMPGPWGAADPAVI